MTDAGQARNFERLRQVQRVELAGVRGDAQPRVARTFRPTVYHGPIRRLIIGRGQDVQPRQATPGGREAARQHGGGPLCGGLRNK